MIVVDASAAIRWFKGATPGGKPFGIPKTDQPLVAPDLFIAEVRNTVLVYLRKKELRLDQAKAMVSTIDRSWQGTSRSRSSAIPLGRWRWNTITRPMTASIWKWPAASARTSSPPTSGWFGNSAEAPIRGISFD
jgi:hypothetical protein